MRPRRRIPTGGLTAGAAGQCDPALAAAVRRLRLQRGVTQEHLAFEAHVTVSVLSRVKRGVANPHWTTIRRITAALGVSLTELATAIEGEAPGAITDRSVCLQLFACT
jgi:transcriptional regulator with XRE-family HTH domain